MTEKPTKVTIAGRRRVTYSAPVLPKGPVLRTLRLTDGEWKRLDAYCAARSSTPDGLVDDLVTKGLAMELERNKRYYGGEVRFPFPVIEDYSIVDRLGQMQEQRRVIVDADTCLTIRRMSYQRECATWKMFSSALMLALAAEEAKAGSVPLSAPATT